MKTSVEIYIFLVKFKLQLHEASMREFNVA